MITGTFEEHHHLLDARIIGVTAIHPETQLVNGLDGAVVVCESEEAMRTWLQTHEVMHEVNFEPATYGGLMESMCKAGFNYHLDAASTALLDEVQSQDLRFHPDILRWESDGWTMLTSSFDWNQASASDLKKQVNAFVMGYRTSAAGDYDVAGLSSETRSIPFTFLDHVLLEPDRPKYDNIAMGRVESLVPWLDLLG